MHCFFVVHFIENAITADHYEIEFSPFCNFESHYVWFSHNDMGVALKLWQLRLDVSECATN